MGERNGRASWNKVGLVTFSSKRYIKISCLSRPLPASPIVATIYLLEQRSFSRYYVVYQSSLCHIRPFSSSPRHPVPPCTFHILPHCEFYSRMLCLKGTSVHLPPPDYWYKFSSFWQVQVPYTKLQFQRFRLVHRAVQIRFHSCLFSEPPVNL